MKINIVAVGKVKESFIRDAIDEYIKRIKKFSDIQVIEIKEYVLSDESSSSIEKAKDYEGKDILSKIDGKYSICLDIDGKELSTIEFKEKICDITLNGISEINFIIGGSYGLSNEVKSKANMRLSFSKMTFPHQLFRLILIEQIYRVFKIINNEPYHK